MVFRSDPADVRGNGRGPVSTFPANVALAAHGKLRKYRKGTLLIQEGDKGDLLYVIQTGRVKVFSADADDREITYAVLGAGDYFGEMSLDGGPRSASVITTEPTECSVLNFEQVRSFLAENPDFAFELLKTVIRRAREATETARGLVQDGVLRRLKAFLERESRPQPDGTRMIAERLTQQDIAGRIGCGREMVSRVLKDLEAGGYVTYRDRLIVLARALPDGL